MSVPRLLGTTICVIAISGCGGSTKHTSTTSSPAERTALQQVAADFINAYDSADTKTLCALLTPAERARLSTQLAAADPSLKGRTCAQLITSGAFGDPSDQPPAIDEASRFAFRRITTDGTHATLAFPDGRSWRLVRSGGRWLIDEIPLIPRSLDSTQTS